MQCDKYAYRVCKYCTAFGSSSTAHLHRLNPYPRRVMSFSGKKFLISGAGIVGLLVAQALKARDMEYVIFERDFDENARDEAGWAITLHWALDAFHHLLPDELVDEIYEAQVRKDFHLRDTGAFKYINASDGSTILSIPPSKRLRVRRNQVRRTLLKGLDVHWNCSLSEVSHVECGRVVVRCDGGQVFEGDVLLGCNGANSQTRKQICGDLGELEYLPLRFCGARVAMTPIEEAKMSSEFDPLLFQGTVPATETFFWYSMLSTPNSISEDGMYFAQVNLSWRIPRDYLELFASAEDKARAMLVHAEGLHPQLYLLVEKASRAPESLVELRLADWPNVRWNTFKGSVLLLGDAAHAMTMYRGEAGNHGFLDVAEWIAQLDAFLEEAISWDESVANYCEKVHLRAHGAVALSRQACLDAHDMSKITPESDSPLLTVRKVS